jgi:dCTP diphosphatase
MNEAPNRTQRTAMSTGQHAKAGTRTGMRRGDDGAGRVTRLRRLGAASRSLRAQSDGVTQHVVAEARQGGYDERMPTTIEALTADIRAFRDARDWAQFHNPKELAVAITAEAGELLQHFVWQSHDQSTRRMLDRRADIESEIADVAILLFELADNHGIDLAAAMRAKLARNEERYPVDKARGSNAKYNEL